jgi:hypothetical protein
VDQNSDAFGHTERIPTLLLYKSIPTLHTRVLGAAAMNAACGVSFGAMIASIPIHAFFLAFAAAAPHTEGGDPV